MFNVNYILAKALQKDLLRNAKKDRVRRQMQANRKKRTNLVEQKAKA
jgi:hypothetical protein